MDVDTITSVAKPRMDEFQTKLQSAEENMPRHISVSATVVLEAAFYLLQAGLLNIPDLGTINVKQGRAFLWHAAWLQELSNTGI